MKFWKKFFENIVAYVGFILFLAFLVIVYVAPGIIALSYGRGWLGLYSIHLVAHAAIDAWPYRK